VGRASRDGLSGRRPSLGFLDRNALDDVRAVELGFPFAHLKDLSTGSLLAADLSSLKRGIHLITGLTGGANGGNEHSGRPEGSTGYRDLE
jgi:hypothetical protein